MSEERRNYRYDRVLIESDRILSPQFNDAVVFLSGAQIELLRNMTQYLRRLGTYVSAYHPDYYLTPDASDYDDILAIVSDLEEVLMGNPNTIWGYKERYLWANDIANADPGTNIIYTSDVPAGEIWRCETLSAINEDNICSHIKIVVYAESERTVLVDEPTPAAGYPVHWDGAATLMEGDSIIAYFYGCIQDDNLTLRGNGYTMDVPE